jgi:hypothetical protein
MPQEWNEVLFQKWNKLRELFRRYKKEQKWVAVISTCENIIQLDSNAKYIQIMVPLFYKEIANAYTKLNAIEKALNYYEISKTEFINYRANNPLHDPNDWLDEIAKIDKKLTKLKKPSSSNTKPLPEDGN